MFTPQKKIFLAWSPRRESNSNSNAIVSGNGGIITGDDNDVEDLDAKLAKLENEDTDLLLTGGMEKVFRIYDLNRPDAPPREVDKSPGSVRTVARLHSDQTILSSCTDIGGVRMSNVLVISFTVCGYLIFSWKEFKVMGNGLC